MAPESRGCTKTSFRCDRSVGCKPSSCACTPEGWACDDDCNGGTCVPLDPPTDPSVCESIAAELAMQVGPSAQTGTCTAVVRVDYTSLKVLGHTFVCGPYNGGGEEMARATADAAATFPNAQAAGHGKLLLAGNLVGSEWIFYQSPSDFGGASAVSSRSGLTVFAGSIVWAGTGTLLVPSAWSTSELGTGCPSVMFPSRGFDLSSGTEFKNGEYRAAVDVVFGTAIPAAMAKLGGVFEAVVLLYPRTVGVLDPKRAEYIVLLNGGALIGD